MEEPEESDEFDDEEDDDDSDMDFGDDELAAEFQTEMQTLGKDQGGAYDDDSDFDLPDDSDGGLELSPDEDGKAM